MFLLLPVVLLAVPSCYGLWTVDRITVQSGGSVTIPCRYNSMFLGHEKFWCRGKLWYTCLTVRESQKSKVVDHPDELVTTLTLNQLEVKDSGRYWCSVRKRGGLKNYIRTSLELQVTQESPDLRVSSSSVSGSEGGNLTLYCYFGDQLKKEQKKWCRCGDLHSCRSQEDTQLSQNAKLQVSDDGEGVFTVTLFDLQQDDRGWYWCSAGGKQAPVHINVTSTSTDQNHTVFPELTSSFQHTTIPITSTHTQQTNLYPHTSQTPHTPHTYPHTPHTPLTYTHSQHTPGAVSLETAHSPGSGPYQSPTTADQQTLSTADQLQGNSTHVENMGNTENRVLVTEPSSSPSAAPRDTGATFICPKNRTFVCVLVIASLLVSAVLFTVFWRRHNRRSHMTVEGAEPLELNDQDDSVLLDQEWKSQIVLKLHEPNTGTLL
ncbi:CMRF35-like molecule 9 [Hoplias malabaricus]|uniref:CMRF35-like molecule 9 n=1 Tax=Hoplias malabaricus TaxID=27720 RepID=UPI0034618DBB